MPFFTLFRFGTLMTTIIRPVLSLCLTFLQENTTGPMSFDNQYDLRLSFLGFSGYLFSERSLYSPSSGSSSHGSSDSMIKLLLSKTVCNSVCFWIFCSLWNVHCQCFSRSLVVSHLALIDCSLVQRFVSELLLLRFLLHHERMEFLSLVLFACYFSLELLECHAINHYIQSTANVTPPLSVTLL